MDSDCRIREKKTQAFAMRCYRRLLNILYQDHVTNEIVRRKIQAAIKEYDQLLTLVKESKLRWFSRAARSSGFIWHSERKNEEEADRRKNGKKTILKSVEEWTLPAQIGQLKTEQD